MFRRVKVLLYIDEEKNQGADVSKKEKERKNPLPAEEGTAAEEQPAAEGKEEEQIAEEAPADEKESALEEAKALAEDYKRKWYSVSAEYENYRKRTQGESAKRYAEGRADVVTKLFPIADNLDRALLACGDEATRKGISMVLDAFKKLLESEHITPVDPAGEPFDAEKMEAIMAVDPAEGEESGTVREVYRKGYEQNGKILRFAQVVVVR